MPQLTHANWPMPTISNIPKRYLYLSFKISWHFLSLLFFSGSYYSLPYLQVISLFLTCKLFEILFLGLRWRERNQEERETQDAEGKKKFRSESFRNREGQAKSQTGMASALHRNTKQWGISFKLFWRPANPFYLEYNIRSRIQVMYLMVPLPKAISIIESLLSLVF